MPKQNVADSGSWKGQANEPAFYYDLAEVAYQALRNNVQVPVAALYKLQSEAKSFLDLSEVELTNTEGTVVEIDILAIVDGRIVLGEAKTSDLVAKTNQGEMLWLQKFRSAAEARRRLPVVAHLAYTYSVNMSNTFCADLP